MLTKRIKLPDEAWVKSQVPLDGALAEQKRIFDRRIIDNLTQKTKFTVVVGPCAADDEAAVNEYVGKLQAQCALYPDLLLVARIYTTKPHSASGGYLGRCFGRGGDGADVDFSEGILACRRMMINCIRCGLPVADELLYPSLYKYFDDLVSYWFVGARSSENVIQRDIASGLELCCGIKNGTDGSIEKAVASVQAVSCARQFPFEDNHVVTSGNKLAHIALRGGFDGQNFTGNIHSSQTAHAKVLLRECGLCDFVMADLSHANSAKHAEKQLDNARKVICDINVDGVMAESYLDFGRADNKYGVSKTDECLSFEQTQELLSILQSGFVERRGS